MANRQTCVAGSSGLACARAGRGRANELLRLEEGEREEIVIEIEGERRTVMEKLGELKSRNEGGRSFGEEVEELEEGEEKEEDSEQRREKRARTWKIT